MGGEDEMSWRTEHTSRADEMNRGQGHTNWADEMSRGQGHTSWADEMSRGTKCTYVQPVLNLYRHTAAKKP